MKNRTQTPLFFGACAVVKWLVLISTFLACTLQQSTMRQHIPLLSLVVTSGYLIPLKAQWVLDNRCRRRLDVEPLNAPSTLANNRGQLAQYLDTQKDDPHFLSSGKADNETDEKEDYWYSGLRGRSEANSRELAVDRKLFIDDPSSFMMHMHFQEGNCWQGTRRNDW